MKKKIVYSLAFLLFLLHLDLWWWNDESLVFGILPVGLAYHALYSIASAIVWGLAVLVAWPDRLEKLAEQDDTGDELSE